MLTESQKGKAAQDLLAQACVIGSQGRINVAFPQVDDEAVDIIFYLRGGSRRVLFAQVKSRWISSQGIRKGIFRSQIRKASFIPRENFLLIFLVCDQDRIHLGENLWLVPSIEFVELIKNQANPLRLVFQSRFTSNDMWTKYRMLLKDLPSRLTELLEQRE